MGTDLILPWSNEYDDYLRDESRSTGEAESISFPQSEGDIGRDRRRRCARGGAASPRRGRAPASPRVRCRMAGICSTCSA